MVYGALESESHSLNNCTSKLATKKYKMVPHLHATCESAVCAGDFYRERLVFFSFLDKSIIQEIF